MKRKTHTSPAQSGLAMSTKPRRRSALTAIFVAAIALLLALPSFASANELGTATSFNTEEEVNPTGIAAGSDGNLWFAGSGLTGGRVVRITPTGTQTGFTSGLQPFTGAPGIFASTPAAMAAGADGNLWFTDVAQLLNGGFAAIGRVDPATGETTEFSEGLAGTQHNGIAPGPEPEENLWFTSTAGNERQHPAFSGSPTGGTFTLTLGAETTAPIEYSTNAGTLRPKIKAALEALAGVGAGNVEVVGAFSSMRIEFIGALAQTNQPQITCNGASLTPAGASCSVGLYQNGGPASIGKITPSGTITNYSVGLNAGSAPRSIAAGPDGNIWFTDEGTTKAIGKITPSGTITEYSAGIPTGGSPQSITAANGKLWFTQLGEGPAKAIGRINTAGTITEFSSTGAAGGPITLGPDGNLWTGNGSTPPKIWRFGITPASPEFELRVNLEEGEGTVTSSPAGIECGAACGKEYTEGTKVVLTASPAPGYLFKSWKGCDTGGVNGRQCTVTMSAARSVGAKFVKVWSLSGSKTGGLGIMSTAPGGVNCGYACLSSSALYKQGSLSVKEKPAKHFHFVEFTGGTGSAASCNGVETETCVFTIEEDSSIEEIYAEDAKNALGLEKEGGGQGFVKTSPRNINCGYTCTSAEAEFFASEEVEVTVALNKGTSSVTWVEEAGTCTGNALTCKVPMNEAHLLVAKLE